jgi:hypothetical protein
VFAFDVETYLGRRFTNYARTEAACRLRHTAERASERSTVVEPRPFLRTTVLSGCYPASLQDGGYTWAVEADDVGGTVISSAQLCEAMRDVYVQTLSSRRITACFPATLTRR